MDQIAIAFTGATAIWLSQDERSEWRKWACIFGLCGQPFWFYSAWVASQWGIFALSFLYTVAARISVSLDPQKKTFLDKK